MVRVSVSGVMCLIWGTKPMLTPHIGKMSLSDSRGKPKRLVTDVHTRYNLGEKKDQTLVFRLRHSIDKNINRPGVKVESNNGRHNLTLIRHDGTLYLGSFDIE